MAVAGLRLTPVEGFVVFVPYILSILYLLISELYLKNENPINSWAIHKCWDKLYIAMPFSMINVLAFQQGEMGQVTFDSLPSIEYLHLPLDK